MKIICTTLEAVVALILIHILTFSSPCLCNEEIINGRNKLPRRLLLLPMANGSHSRRLMIMKSEAVKQQPEKRVEQRLRKAPPSVSDPIQNK
ncbi:hypothetical protein MANES_09G033750v8 [Manihot esculenta]|uniref:Uncharacterized protein n=1 Tax=Manihot esculenta TaxID=3983 RepID=A0ACB7H458_MANES|nr:hypothetical protein MANES_09G033750v8 [Manihot esculenta]